MYRAPPAFSRRAPTVAHFSSRPEPEPRLPAYKLKPGEPAIWYRLMFLDKPIGPWRPSMSDVLDDALDLRHAERSKRYGRIFMTAPAWVACVDLERRTAEAI